MKMLYSITLVCLFCLFKLIKQNYTLEKKISCVLYRRDQKIPHQLIRERDTYPLNYIDNILSCYDN